MPPKDTNFVVSEPIPNAFGRLIDLTLQAATSRLGQVAAYFAAVAAAVIACQKVAEPLKDTSPWIRAALIFSLPLLVLIFQAVPVLVERRRARWLTQITGDLKTGYFSLRPWEDEKTFVRADGEHQEILQWLEQRRGLLCLTGLSGTGKSSLLNAWVLPHLLREHKACVIRLRGYQDPLTALRHELQQPGVIWEKPSFEEAEIRFLLERACQHIRPRRLIIVFDQFEEFVILQNTEQQKPFVQFLSSLHNNPLAELTVLLVFRSDYIGPVEQLRLPPLLQNVSWKEVSPFTERAAREFIEASGLLIDEKLLWDVLREAAEIERRKAFICPITVNLCGLVLARFATGLHGGFRPGALVPGFVRESILLPELHDVAPKVIPHLITSYVTKRPRTIDELAESTSFDRGVVLGCLRRLGQNDRSIVRSLDPKQELWEISHDFLVPLLDSIVSRLRVSFWKRLRSWLPWIAAGGLAVTVVLLSNWRRDPIDELAKLDWILTRTDDGRLRLETKGVPTKGSDALLRMIRTSPLTSATQSLLSAHTEFRNLTKDYEAIKAVPAPQMSERARRVAEQISVIDDRDLSPGMQVFKYEDLAYLWVMVAYTESDASARLRATQQVLVASDSAGALIAQTTGEVTRDWIAKDGASERVRRLSAAALCISWQVTGDPADRLATIRVIESLPTSYLHKERPENTAELRPCLKPIE